MTMRQLYEYFAAHPYSISDYKIIIRSRGKRHSLDAGDISIDHTRHEIYL
jgi:hypothetical protein